MIADYKSRQETLPSNLGSGFLATWVLPVTLTAKSKRFLIVVSPDNHTYKFIRETNKLVLHLASEKQVDQAVSFGCLSGADTDKIFFSELSNISQASGQAGVEEDKSSMNLVLKDCAGYVEAEVTECFDIGERILVVCRSISQATDPSNKPLTKEKLFEAVTPGQLELLKKRRTELATKADKFWSLVGKHL